MRSLVFLVAITHCWAHLGPFHVAPWVPPFAKPITEDSAEEAPTTLPSLLHPYGDYLGSPYLLHPLGHYLPSPYILPLQNVTVGPFGHPLYAPYLHGIGGLVGYPPLGLPYVALPEEEEEEDEDEDDNEEEEEEESRRRRRNVSVPLPYLHPVPTTKDVTVETTHYEPVDADTPADTTKIELTTKEHELTVPAVKYVQPHVSLKPFTYSVVSPAVYPAVLPHLGPYTGYPYHYPYPYPYPYPVALLDHD